MTLTITNAGRPVRRWATLAAVAVVGVAGGGFVLRALIAGDHRAPVAATRAPPSLKSVGPDITSVSLEGPVLAIRAAAPEAPNAAAYVDLAGMTAREVGKALQGGVSDNVAGAASVELTFTASVADKVGKAVAAPFMVVNLPVAGLEAADYANLQWPGVLDLADHVMTTGPAGLDAVKAWCAEAPNAGRPFCLKALPK